MSSPTAANEAEAFEGLLVAVECLHTFFTMAKMIEQLTPKLLVALASDDCQQMFISHPALVRQLAELLSFAHTFDSVRMLRPSLSNDFSYYRRLLPKFTSHPDVKVKDDDASGMALFTAEHIPMTNALVRGTAVSIERNGNVPNVLALLANSCMTMIKQHHFIASDINLMAARACVHAIIAFDHNDPSGRGAFSKGSPIAIKQVIRTLKREFPTESSLLSALQYSSKHFKDADAKMQAMFE